MNKLTLEQKRAQDAWDKSGDYTRKHVNIIKGLPFLLMNGGLMQVMAFMNDRGAKHKEYADIAIQLREWLSQRFQHKITDSSFNTFMQAMMTTDSQTYQAINAEAFAWLKWLRQMAAARNGGN